MQVRICGSPREAIPWGHPARNPVALEAFRGLPGVLGLFRIDKRGDRHVMVGYDDEAMAAVLDVHFEVRG